MKQSEINQSWSESAPNYDSIIHDELRSFRVEAWQEQILSHFPAGQTLQILDIGCGPGFFSIIWTPTASISRTARLILWSAAM